MNAQAEVVLNVDDGEFLALRELAVNGDSEAMVSLVTALRARGNYAEASRWLVRAGAAGHPLAVAMLALPATDTVDPYSTHVLDWIRRAAEGGNRDCMLLLAKAYRDGSRGMEQDYRQMLRWLLHAVAAGASEAARLLSDAYVEGLGVPENSGKAFAWLKRAAEAGDTMAMARMAENYLKGRGTPRDVRAYFQWTYRGAEAGDPAMMFNLANAYRAGVGTEADTSGYFQWTRKAADRGYPAALFSLARAYRDGIGVKPDREEYRRILTQAAAAGDPQAMNDLAILYLRGDGLPADAQRHFRWLQRAAEAGEPNAMFNLAHAFRDGIGIAKDEQQYLAWLERGAELRYPNALVELAAWHYRNLLSHQRTKETVLLAEDMRFKQLARTAAEAGDARAMYLLAMAHRGAISALSDAARARRWIERAAEAGLPIAMLDLAAQYHDGRGYEKDLEKYFFWIRRAAEAGDCGAARLLGLAYHDGEGTVPDLDACQRWLEQAASRGDQAAFVLLGLLELERAGEILPGVLRAALEPFMGLQAEVEKIKQRLLVREAPEGVAYFTTLSVFNALLAEEPAEGTANRLRLYNAAYLEDLQEGRRLFELAGTPAAALLRTFFPQQGSRDWPITTPWDGREYSVYLGSFNLRGDYLDLWRAHGAEGAGVCIVTPLAAFTQDRERLPLKPGHADTAGDPDSAQMPAAERRVPAVLYRVEYDPATAVEALEAMRPHMEDIRTFKDLLKQGRDTVDALVRILVSEILYLFKPEAYRGECEARVLASFDIASDYVRRDDSRQPANLYIETEPFLFTATGSCVLIGPAVRERAAVYLDLQHRLARSRWASSTRVSYSSIEYR